MSSRYIEIDSAAFFQFLESKGFTKTLSSGNEVVYIRHHDREPRIVIKVYTSIREGAVEARECGADAIRCIALFQADDKTYPLFKGARVYRTGSQDKVHERTLERMRDAYARCNSWLKDQRPWGRVGRR